MRKTFQLLLLVLPLSVTSTANAQFFGLGWHRNPAPRLPEPNNVPGLAPGMVEGNACTMRQCIPKSPLGYHMESWRRWPGTDSIYSKTRGVTTPKGDTSLPQADIPNALDETNVVPRKRPDKANDAAKTPGSGIDVIPSAPADSNSESDDLNVNMPEDIIPESDTGSDLDSTTSDDLGSDLGNDLGGDLDSGLGGDLEGDLNDNSNDLNSPVDTDPIDQDNGNSLEDLLPDDDFGDDLGSAAPRRLKSRDDRRSLSHSRARRHPLRTAQRGNRNVGSSESSVEQTDFRQPIEDQLQSPNSNAPAFEQAEPARQAPLQIQKPAQLQLQPQAQYQPATTQPNGQPVPQTVFIPQPQQQGIYIGNQYYVPQQPYIPQQQLAPQYVPQSGFQVPAGYRPAQIGQPAPSAHMRPQNFTSNAKRIQQRSDQSVQRASHLAQQHNLKPAERSNGDGSTRKLPVNNNAAQNNKKINQRRSSSQKKATPRKGSRVRRTRSNPLRPAKNRSVELPVPDSKETIEFPVEEAQSEPKTNTISMSNPYR